MTDFSLLSPLAVAWMVVVGGLTASWLESRVRKPQDALIIGLVIGAATLFTPLPAVIFGWIFDLLNNVTGST